MRRLAVFGSLAVVISLSFSALADGPATDFVKGRQAELSGLIKAGGAGSNKKVEAVFDTILDYDALAQNSLREQWGERSEAERREFQDVLKQLVQRAYRRNLDRTIDYDVRYEGASKGEGADVIRTVAQNRKNLREDPVSVDYVVRKVGANYRISDIVTEGSSLVNNYHQQFAKIIKKDGFPALLKKMKAKLAKGEKTDSVN